MSSSGLRVYCGEKMLRVNCGESKPWLAQVGDGVFEVLSTSGDTHLGGDDFDKRIVDHLSAEFQARGGHRPAQRPPGAAAAHGGFREGQDGAVHAVAGARLLPWRLFRKAPRALKSLCIACGFLCRMGLAGTSEEAV